MQDRIIEILSKYSECDKSSITKETSLVVDLGLTSLDILKLVMDLEEEFGVEFDEDEIADLITISDLEEYIKKQNRGE